MGSATLPAGSNGHRSLLTRGGVDHAPHPPGGHEAGHAAHRSAYTGPDLPLPTLPGLHHQLGIGDHPPNHRNQIGNPAADQMLGVVHGHDASGDDGGHLNGSGHHLAGGDFVAEALIEGGQQSMEAPVGRQGHIQEVDAGFHQGGDGSRLLGIHPTLDLVIGRDADAHRETGAGLLADGSQDLPQEPGAVLQAAAVVVVAPVGGRGEELADEIAVGGVEFHPVEPALLAPPGGGGERPHNLVDHGAGQGLGNDADHGVGHRAGG